MPVEHSLGRQNEVQAWLGKEKKKSVSTWSDFVEKSKAWPIKKRRPGPSLMKENRPFPMQTSSAIYL